MELILNIKLFNYIMDDFFSKYLERLGIIDDDLCDEKSKNNEESDDFDDVELISPEFIDKHCVYMIRYKKNNKYWYKVGFTVDIKNVIDEYSDIEVLYLFITKNQNFEIILKYKIYESKIDIIDGDYEVNHTLFNLLDNKSDYKNPFYTIDIDNIEKYCDVIITNNSTRLNKQLNYRQDSLLDFPNTSS